GGLGSRLHEPSRHRARRILPRPFLDGGAAVVAVRCRRRSGLGGRVPVERVARGAVAEPPDRGRRHHGRRLRPAVPPLVSRFGRARLPPSRVPDPAGERTSGRRAGSAGASPSRKPGNLSHDSSFRLTVSPEIITIAGLATP